MPPKSTRNAPSTTASLVAMGVLVSLALLVVHFFFAIFGLGAVVFLFFGFLMVAAVALPGSWRSVRKFQERGYRLDLRQSFGLIAIAAVLLATAGYALREVTKPPIGVRVEREMRRHFPKGTRVEKVQEALKGTAAHVILDDKPEDESPTSEVKLRLYAYYDEGDRGASACLRFNNDGELIDFEVNEFDTSF
jgi:hypothetical protein